MQRSMHLFSKNDFYNFMNRIDDLKKECKILSKICKTELKKGIKNTTEDWETIYQNKLSNMSNALVDLLQKKINEKEKQAIFSQFEKKNSKQLETIAKSLRKEKAKLAYTFAPEINALKNEIQKLRIKAQSIKKLQPKLDSENKTLSPFILHLCQNWLERPDDSLLWITTKKQIKKLCAIYQKKCDVILNEHNVSAILCNLSNIINIDSAYQQKTRIELNEKGINKNVKIIKL